MSATTSQQLNEIHSMLASGHRSIRMERHTLVLWGLAAAFLILTVEYLFTPEWFPVAWQQIVAMNLFISMVLLAVGVCESFLTRRLRRERDESISFVQHQLTKVWWLLVALIVVINIGMSFFGGGSLFYGISIILVGVALYIHGLFSQQMLVWGGVMFIILGLFTLSMLPTYLAQKSLAVSVYGIGLPALALMMDRNDMASFNLRSLFISAGWMAAVILPAVLGYYLYMNMNLNIVAQ